MNVIRRQQPRLIWSLIRLTLLLFCTQAIAMYFNFGQLVRTSPVNRFIADEVLQSPTVLSGLAGFIGAQLLLYAGFILLIWGVTRLVGKLFNIYRENLLDFGLLLWADAVITLFLANQYFFPNSQFSALLRKIHDSVPFLAQHMPDQKIVVFLLFIFGGLWLVAMLAALTYILILAIRHLKVSGAVLLILLLCVGGYYYYVHYKKPASQAYAPNSSKPNIVLLSIDYFRPDDTFYFGNKREVTPNIDRFLNQATVFKHTLSAIARTFPSLMSVESGTYPKQSGARHNLIIPSLVNHQNTLGHILQNQQYYTLLATDGSHFFYMDSSYGFNQILAPKPGFNEFLLSSINDFPLSNLVMNTPIGKHLFPYNYMNRNANVTYTPKTFNKELQHTLVNRPANQPLYIHIHLTLAAWPYVWNKAAPLLPNGLTAAQKSQFLFEYGLSAVDNQFGQIQQLLQKEHILDNAMLVVFSDHGQAFGELGDRITRAENYVGTPDKTELERFTNLKNAIGHGTDILSLKQSHPLLAFKMYGRINNQSGSRNLTASLIDISPTVLNYLRLPSPSMQGISLLPDIISNTPSGLGDRALFMETELTLPSILTADPSISKVLDEGIGYYQLDKKTGMLEVKPLFTRLILKGKQRAVVQGHWMLAMYPNPEKPATLVLVNLANQQWTTDMLGAFAQNSPLPQLLNELQQFYGNEVAVPTVQFSSVQTSVPETKVTPIVSTKIKPVVTTVATPVIFTTSVTMR